MSGLSSASKISWRNAKNPIVLHWLTLQRTWRCRHTHARMHTHFVYHVGEIGRANAYNHNWQRQLGGSHHSVNCLVHISDDSILYPDEEQVKKRMKQMLTINFSSCPTKSNDRPQGHRTSKDTPNPLHYFPYQCIIITHSWNEYFLSCNIATVTSFHLLIHHQ